jgi:hypothetical protein
MNSTGRQAEVQSASLRVRLQIIRNVITFARSLQALGSCFTRVDVSSTALLEPCVLIHAFHRLQVASLFLSF